MPVLTTNTKRILYIHVPKTGGSWVEDLMRSYGSVSGVRFGDSFDGLPCSPQHFHAPLLEHMYSTDRWAIENSFDFVFMTVRDPLTRLQSEFRYRIAPKRWTRWKRRLGRAMQFSPWVRRHLGRYRTNAFTFDNHLRPQHEFLAFEATVFRLEDGLERIADVLDELAGTRGKVPERPVNQSADLLTEYHLSRRARDMIWTQYETDFQRFGYAPPDDWPQETKPVPF